MTLGEIIKKLEAYKTVLGKDWYDRLVFFDFCMTVPTHFDSYRGYYDKLAINWSEGTMANGKGVKAEEFLKMCTECNGKVFTGYKGGEFKMFLDTEVYVDNYGFASGTIVKDIKDDGYYSIKIITANEND